MDSSKTQIYRGGLAGLMGKQASPALGGDDTVLKLIDPAASRTRPPPPLPSELHATRIMPIERLLPSHAAAFSGQASRGEKTAARPLTASGSRPVTRALVTKPKPIVQARKAQKRARRRRYLGHVVIGVLTATAVVVWRLPLEGKPAQARKPAAMPQPQREPSVTGVAPRDVQLARADLAEPAGHQPHSPLAERAAIDAVFAGDYASAQRMYRELARAKPTSPVFSEAARILAARESPHP